MSAGRIRRPFTLAAGTAAGGVVLFAPAAEAATFNVTNLNDSGDGSLRDAIIDANLDATADQVVFQSGLSGTITLTTGALEINEPVTIQGPGANVITISGNDADRVFYIDPNTDGIPVSISDLTMTRGLSPSDDGGALYATDTDLTIADSVFVDNEAGDVGGAMFPFESDVTITNTAFRQNEAGAGGAIFSQDGTIEIANSTIAENDAVYDGGGFFVQDTDGPGGDDVVFRDSVVSGNELTGDNASGGGIHLDGVSGNIVLERTTVSGNIATGDGGGLAQESESSSKLTILSSTFSGNAADSESDSNGAGGGLSFSDGGPLTITNSTFSGNSSYYGGGVASYNYDDEPVTIANSTIVGNSTEYASGGGGISAYGGDGAADGVDSLTLSSSIVAGNSGPANPDIGGDASGDLELAGAFNLIGSTPVIPFSGSGPNLIGVDPQLGPLANNGGPTQTHLPALTSPVIDAGVANGLATDQRGAPRNFDAANVANAPGSDGTDIGSVELLPGNRLALGQCKGKVENFLFTPGTPITGTDADDVIVGTPGADSINSGKGKDTVCAGAGNDSVKAGAGKDNVSGQAGKDKLKGNGGNDKLQGNAGRDTLKGGGGKDTLKGGGGKDKLRGGPGRDKLKGGGGKDSERQ